MNKSSLRLAGVSADSSSTSLSPPLVLLHGWGSSSQVWAKLKPLLIAQYDIICIDLPGFGLNSELEIHSLDELFQAIESALPEQCHIIGWSLGGMLAAELVARNPQRFLSFTSIAANVKFAASDDWPQGCAQDLFHRFYSTFEENPRLCIKKFNLLQTLGDSEHRHCLSFLNENSTGLAFDEAPIKDKWLFALALLNRLDNRKSLAAQNMPRLAILGERDSLVPSGVAQTLTQNAYYSRAEIIPGAAHLPHVTQAEKVAELVRDCVAQGDRRRYARQKQKLADAFSGAAQQYDKLAALQLRVAARLVSMHREAGGLVCDIGCGTGFCAQEFEPASCELVGLDIAFGMLNNCRMKNLYQQQNLVCADFDKLPLAEGVFDGVVSSMSLQWSENLSWSLREIRRILKPAAQSWLLFSTLGPQTLHELRGSWQSVDPYVHVNRFESLSSVQNSLQDNGFSIVKQKVEMEVLPYASAMTLMRELKAIGAHNINAGNKSSLTTRRQLLALNAAYERYRSGDTLPASYEVFYFLAELNT